MSRDNLVPKQVTRSDGTKATYWVRPDHKRYGIGVGIVAAAMVPVAALGLSGCASGPEDGPEEPTPSGSSQPAETPAPSPEPTEAAPIEGDTNGDGKLSEFEKQVAAKNAPRPYALPDGSTVTVDPKQPLPPAVKTVIVNKVDASVDSAGATSSGQTMFERNNQVKAYLDAESEATGKKLVAVYQVNSVDGRVWIAIASGDARPGLKASTDKSAFSGSVQAWADNRGYEILYFD